MATAATRVATLSVSADPGAPPHSAVDISIPTVKGSAHIRTTSREAEARAVRLIRLKSPKGRRERGGTFVRGTDAHKSHQAQRQHWVPNAPYVTIDAKETLVTNYIVVIELTVIEW
ncbi:hypothetical protein MLIT_18210 [Mycolicibacterium litorale]|uniref:Uncharacterized protein n=1 Tax=Mycolicibacterium litorale TaxID=758802 RepID=A0AAD1MRH7_9MYCO|nr:hypothetical protein MLIT_18210 [Mycolicibacterium litorale]